ncbi:MAG TPA: 30S ribosomal protein S4 [bacterium]|jgi:small subunit ribosomal protein S4|nr:30S ribosomal protein S4 [bacterium]
MTTTNTSTCSLCRTAGKKLFLKGDKCNSPKCALTKRPTPAGMHGAKRPAKKSQYGEQLAEKQHAKKMYGMRERQFRTMFEKAQKKGDAGENLLRALETRFDNVIFRLGYASSRAQARQMVNHGLFVINDEQVDIPSYQVKAGDIIKIKKNKLQKKVFLNIDEKLKKATVPGWLNYDAMEKEAKVLHVPAKEDLEKSINSQIIVEFYSK